MILKGLCPCSELALNHTVQGLACSEFIAPVEPIKSDFIHSSSQLKKNHENFTFSIQG
jgi:hypothetical protein